MQRVVDKRYHSLIGKAFLSHGVGAADRVVDILVNYKIEDNVDLDKISEMHHLFQNINVIDTAIETKCLFVGVILKEFFPYVFYLPKGILILKRGTLKRISDCINQDYGNTSKMIRNVIFRFNHYKEFEERVNQLIQIINGEKQINHIEESDYKKA